MEWSAAWMWLIGGVVLGGVELAVGTFYLLVLGVACLAGSVTAALGADPAWQIAAVAVLAVAGCGLVYRMRGLENDAVSDRLQNPDVGQTVLVGKIAEDGTAEVAYRGSVWCAVAESGRTLAAGRARIVRVDGARLVVRTEKESN